MATLSAGAVFRNFPLVDFPWPPVWGGRRGGSGTAITWYSVFSPPLPSKQTPTTGGLRFGNWLRRSWPPGSLTVNAKGRSLDQVTLPTHSRVFYPSHPPPANLTTYTHETPSTITKRVSFFFSISPNNTWKHKANRTGALEDTSLLSSLLPTSISSFCQAW